MVQHRGSPPNVCWSCCCDATPTPADPPQGFAAFERLTGALLDRLTHHVHILEMNGDSYRLNQSQKRRKPPKT